MNSSLKIISFLTLSHNMVSCFSFKSLSSIKSASTSSLSFLTSSISERVSTRDLISALRLSISFNL